MVSQNSKAVFEAALQLPADDRVRLATQLWQSLDARPDPDGESDWEREIDRRIQAARQNPSRLVDGQETLRQLEAGQRPGSLV